MYTAKKIIAKICERENIPYKLHHPITGSISIIINGNEYFFIGCEAPFNPSTFSTIARRKSLTYKVLESVIRMPKTIILRKNDGKEIEDKIKKITKSLSFPLIVKMNSGLMGKNVFLCRNEKDISKALHEIYHGNNYRRDVVALAQEYIKVNREFRAVVFMNELIFLYTKSYEVPKFENDEGIAYRNHEIPKPIEDKETMSKVSDFLKKIYPKLDVEYSGIDVIENSDGELFLIELNTEPSYLDLMNECGTKQVEILYEKMIQYLLKK